VPDIELPGAIIVDIDGTMALNDTGHRTPYEYDKVLDDEPNWPVIDVVNAVYATLRYSIVYVSGRPEYCRRDTEAWLDLYAPDGMLFMRAGESHKKMDRRSDVEVKREIFDTHIRHEFNVHAVFDDRARVVQMWRSLGLTVFQVADGDF
jgi:hypothetical protein